VVLDDHAVVTMNEIFTQIDSHFVIDVTGVSVDTVELYQITDFH